ncbi:MAG: hypothetical protein K0S65_6560 [Labilithrix sp.]|nr:hypothetical protein [Labilithrix sp.]
MLGTIPRLALADELEQVQVRGESRAERTRRSAEAVDVVDTTQARRESGDLGDVLARAEGVAVRRSGALGSAASFSLNGLTAEQVRFFVDGIPLELSGYAFGIANVPVTLANRVEIYRGVVPVRFGADALGGAVNIITSDATNGTHGSVSYQAGSFDTHRITVGARHLFPENGFFARVNGFFDRATNDYPIDVEAPDDRGRIAPVRVHRFHDDYAAHGGGVDAGFVNRWWAKRAFLRAFVGEHKKDVQHNLLMTVPYGEAAYGKRTYGVQARYEQVLGRGVRFDATTGYAYTRTDFLDLATCRYDWFGRCVSQLPQPGEVEPIATDQTIRQHVIFGRYDLTWSAAADQTFRFGLAPTFTSRTGRNRAGAQDDYDPLRAQRDLTSAVAGVEYETRALESALVNIGFLKSYHQLARTEEQLPNAVVRDLDVDVHRFGVGDSLRYRFAPELYAKASYERATRLPTPDEIFGNGVLVVENLHLAPESSHNVNLGLTLERARSALGDVRFDANGFARLTDDLVVLVGSDAYSQYRNVLAARIAGVEGSVGWTSPGEWVALDASVTWQDIRSARSEGAFARDGSRIPNRPWLFGNASARLQWPQPFSPADLLALTWRSRYVHEFFRGWEGLGADDQKLAVPTQLLHSVALSYVVRSLARSFSATLEVQNLTDERVFDFFGVQRPGRAAFGKLVVDL